MTPDLSTAPLRYPVKQGWKLYLDDVRPVPAGWELVRTYAELRAALQREQALPGYLSLDHDLGEHEPSGLDAVKLLVYGLRAHLDGVELTVHSQNPVGKANMEGLLRSWQKECKAAQQAGLLQYGDLSEELQQVSQVYTDPYLPEQEERVLVARRGGLGEPGAVFVEQSDFQARG